MRAERKTIGEIGATIELTAEGVAAEIARHRAVADLAVKRGRMLARASWLERKAGRLPLGNGKTKASREAQMLRALASALA